MFTDSSQHYRDDVRCQLRSRLRVSAILLLIGTVAFLVRFLLVGIAHEPISPTILTAHVSLIAILGVSALILCGRCNIALGKLRIAEVIIFGAPAAFFVWAPYCRFCEVEQPNLLMVGSFLAQITIPWMILIQIYSVYIPNTARRTAAVVGAMAVLPLGSAWILGNRHPQLNELLFQLGGFSAISLWIVLSAIIAVYGAARFGRLNREAFDAQRLGTYILRDKLGSGGMGEVYLAEHRLLKRKCAIKLIRDEKAGDPQAIARFETEVRSSARLTHPNTIEIYDYGHTDDGTFYYVMEYLPGINLQEMVERFGPLPPERVVHLLLPVTSALREAHDAGLIHRDIKPGNIFASERGGMRDVPKLLDFGLVKTLFPQGDSVKLTIEGAVVGSPLFASPESVLEGEPDARSDIYSLGATAYFLLTGRPVFDGASPLKIIFAHASEPPALPSSLVSGIPPALEAVVMKCLAKKPADRYQTAGELEAALSALNLADGWTRARSDHWWNDTFPQREGRARVSQVDDATITTPVPVSTPDSSPLETRETANV